MKKEKKVWIARQVMGAYNVCTCINSLVTIQIHTTSITLPKVIALSTKVVKFIMGVGKFLTFVSTSTPITETASVTQHYKNVSA